MRLKNKDIAEQLGISTTAVSLALNNRPGVSEATRRRVLELVSDSTLETIHSLNEEMEPAKRSILLSVHKKNGVIINDKPFFSNITEAAQQELLKEGYNMILSHYVPSQGLNQYIQYIKGLPIAGVLLVATELDSEDLAFYKQLDIPMVLLDGSFDFENLDSVTLDNERAILRAFAYGVKMGHRRIGYLKSESFINNFGHRMDGFMKGIRDFGLENEPHPVISLPCDVEGAYQRMSEYLSNLDKDFQMPTLFLSDLDYIALGAMNAFEEHGYAIPDDVSFIGYDDVATSAVSKPPLTTIRVNQSDIGRYAAHLLLDRIESYQSLHITMQVASELVIRESVKDLRA